MGVGWRLCLTVCWVMRRFRFKFPFWDEAQWIILGQPFSSLSSKGCCEDKIVKGELFINVFMTFLGYLSPISTSSRIQYLETQACIHWYFLLEEGISDSWMELLLLTTSTVPQNVLWNAVLGVGGNQGISPFHITTLNWMLTVVVSVPSKVTQRWMFHTVHFISLISHLWSNLAISNSTMLFPHLFFLPWYLPWT